MKKLLCLLLLFSTALHAQRIPTIGINKVRITAPTGTILAEITAKGESDLYTDRIYHWYSSNTIHTTQGGYSGKLLNGAFQEFYANKGLKEQGEFKKGLKSGAWKTWHENGSLSQLATWRNGIKDGTFTLYDEQGAPRQQGRYENNLLDGKVLIYHGKDSVETVRYKAGQVVSTKLASPTLWQKVKTIRWKRKEVAGGSGTPATPQPKPKKVKKQKGKDTLAITY